MLARASFLTAATVLVSFAVACGGNGDDSFAGAPPLGIGGATASSAGNAASAGTSAGSSSNGTGSTGGTGTSATGSTGGTGGVGGTQAGGGTGALAVCEPNAQSIHDTIIAPSCTARLCHGSGAPAAALDLSVSDWAANLVGVSASTCDGWARVVPGSPEQSFLYEKISKDAPACGGVRMPSGSILPEQYIQCVADWIMSLGQGSCETCGGATCVSLPSDQNNCGSCGNVCPAGSTCQNGGCACSSGQSACGSACVDESKDAMHCGGCNIACSAGAACTGGQCVCTGSLAACGSSCADLQSDPANCGTCGNACGSGDVCLSGSCSSGCGGLTQCGSSCVDLKTTSADCGSCGHVCGAGLVCADGACGCASGLSACGTTCVDLTSDATNCGACGVSCGPGSTCSNGQCQCGASSVSFQTDVQPIFTASCTNAGCHSGAKAKEGLSLESGKAYAALVGVAAAECGSHLRVKAGDVGQSYLMDKLLGVNLCSGSQMPKAGQALPTVELAKISDWICQGAKSN